jgi:hypothetical protein
MAEGFKPWQHGYSFEVLDPIVDLFAGHDVGYSLADMTAVNRRDVAEWLHKRRCHVSQNAAVVARITGQRSTVTDFTGAPRARSPEQTLAIDRVAGNVDDVLALLGDLPDVARNVQLTGWVDHPCHVELAERLGLQRVATKIRATSEVVAVWSRAPFVALGDEDAVGIERLPIDVVDIDAAVAELDRLDEWAVHYSNYNVGRSWHAVALRSFGGDPQFIAKPSEMTRAWRRDNEALTAAQCIDTPLAALLPAVNELAAGLPGGSPERVRLMRLDTGGLLDRHSDISDRDAGTRNGQLARLHIPLVTNDSVEFGWWDINNVRHDRRMRLGETWYLDQRKAHRASNDGEARVHLVVDVPADDELRDLLRAAYAGVT